MCAYPLSWYGRIIADRTRLEAYHRALQAAVTPGSVVIDIGTGTGIFALLACQLGAGRVYAIDPDDSIDLARQVAAANGYADRVRFFQQLSTDLVLPEQGDVIVSDLRDVLPLHRHHIPAIVDARRRLLAPTGVLIPRQDTIRAGIVEAPGLYADCAGPWEDHPYGLDMEPARRMATNMWHACRASPEQLLASPQTWAVLDYRTIASPDVQGQLKWITARAGTVHGLVLWFDADLAEQVGFSNRPEAPELVYRSAFFPLTRPVAVDEGDTFTVSMAADLVDNDYIWRWATTVLRQGDASAVTADYDQSTFRGAPLPLEKLRRRAPGHVPVLSDDGRVDLAILRRMDGTASLEDIAEAIRQEFPSCFPTGSEALKRVGAQSERYSRLDHPAPPL